MPRLLLALVLLCPLIAGAADFDLTCAFPTQNTDGSNLTNLAGVNLYGGKQDASPTLLSTATVAQGCKFTRTNVSAGTHVYTVTAFNSLGVESAQSSPVTRVVDPTPTCVAAPATVTRSQTCPAPTIGNWTQTNAWTPAPAPTCWAPAWLPADPPAGICADPPPPMLATAAVQAYEEVSATLPLALRGITAIGRPCGPQTLTRNGVKYCAVPKSAVDLVVWPSNLSGDVYWVKAGLP